MAGGGLRPMRLQNTQNAAQYFAFVLQSVAQAVHIAGDLDKPLLARLHFLFQIAAAPGRIDQGFRQGRTVFFKRLDLVGQGRPPFRAQSDVAGDLVQFVERLLAG